MLDKTQLPADAQLQELGIGIQLATTIGGTRSLTLTAGVPLVWSKSQIDDTLDKLAAACDRQKRLFDIEQTKMLLKNEEQNLHQFRVQVAAQEQGYRAEFTGSGRQGEWKPSGAQRSQLGSLQKNVDNSAQRIEQLRKTITELQEGCR